MASAEPSWFQAPNDRAGQEREAIMNYSVFIYETPADFAKRSDPKIMDAYFGTWMKYFQTLGEAGIMRGGSGLLPPDTATTVRLRQGQRVVEDGPYADPKEQLGGVIMIDVPDIAAAVAGMWRFPAVHPGVVELRPNLPRVATLIATAKADALAG